MTDIEIAQIFQELRGASLLNEPKDPAAAVKLWRDFFGGDDARVIAKAAWIHINNSRYWPTPRDIKELKEKASWLVTLDQRKLQEASRKSLEPPKAPRVLIEETFCDMCGLCDEKDQDNCPLDV
ncbi:MAG: hypothetical protein IKU36_06270 [Bacteroidales bacterium]|nr:hypothetical protein [Bacteroidales bacterium]